MAPDFEEQLAWGWVPAHVTNDLQEVGDWRRRAAAVEVLHAAALALGAPGTGGDARLLATFSSFLDFFLPLLADPNFKIAVSAMTILDSLVGLLGSQVLPYLGSLVASLGERLGNNVKLVRKTAAREMAALARAVGPSPVINALGGALVHTSWRVRKGALDVVIAALLSHGRGEFDYPRVVGTLVTAADDDTPCVQVVALEGLALLHSRLGPLLQGLMTTVGAADAVKRRVAERVAADLGLPSLDDVGGLRHQSHVRPSSANEPGLPPVDRGEAAQPAAASIAGAPMRASLEVPAATAATNLWGLSEQQAAPAGECAASPLPLPLVAAAAYSAAGEDAASCDPPAALRTSAVASGWGSESQYSSISYGAAPTVSSSYPGAPVEPAAADVERSGGSRLQWMRPARSPNGSFTSTQMQRPMATATAAASPLPSAAAAEVSKSAVAAADTAAASRGKTWRRWRSNPASSSDSQAAQPPPTINQDLRISVRAWQQQRNGKEGAAPSSAAQQQQQQQPDRDVAQQVEGSSGSLLVWRMPSRTQQQPQRDSRPAPAVEPGGGPGLLHKLGSFRKKLFGAEAVQQPGDGQSQWPGSSEWSIPASHGVEHRERQESVAAAAGDEAGGAALEEEQPPSPSSILGKLRQLKARQQSAAERRRVWSAPAVPAASEPAAPPTAVLDSVPEESVSQPSSPQRPTLQALKTRAMTARALSAASRGLPSSPGASAGNDAHQYSMEALEDVFGPDRAVCGASSGWSPLRVNVPGSQSGAPSCQASSLGSPGWPSSPGGSMKRLSSSTSTFLSKLSAIPSADSVPGSPAFNPAAADMTPLEHPEQAVQQLLASLQAAAVTQKRELDWQAQLDALGLLRRVARHHSQVLLPVLHTAVAAAAPVMESLRSIPARLALLTFQASDLIWGLGPALEGELDAFVPILLKRAGAVSVAGRDSFLAVEADKALSALVALRPSCVKVAASLLSALDNTKSRDARAKGATHLAACAAAHARELVAAGGPTLLTRLLRTAVGLLDEGSLETRTGGKRLLWELRGTMDAPSAGGSPGNFKRAVDRLECRTAKVWEVLGQQDAQQLGTGGIGGGLSGYGLSLGGASSAGPYTSPPAPWSTRPPSGRLGTAAPRRL